MTQEPNENRIVRTYSLLELTEKMVVEISKKTFRSKANVIDLAVAELYTRVMASEGEVSEPAETVSK
ncbi:MAG: hypothetical protein WC837_04560 [Bellilinea sp.]